MLQNARRAKVVQAQWRQRRKAVKTVTLMTKVNVVTITSMATLVPKIVKHLLSSSCNTHATFVRF